MVKPLSDKPARTDFTDRELTRIIGGLLGSLAGVAENMDALRNAVRWWAETDEAWQAMERQEWIMRQTGGSPRR